MAGPNPGPQPGPRPGAQGPGQSGTIDVKPSDLHRVSGGVAAQQTPMDKGAKDLLETLRKYPDAGGYGTAPEAFAAAYVKVGNRFLEVWAKSVVSIGGAATGFTATANNYAKAEAANDPTGKTKAVTQPLPKVIEEAPVYGSVPNLKWGDDDGGDDFIRTLLEWVPGPVREVLRPIVKHAYRMGKVAEVYPYPQQHYLDSLSKAWMAMTMTLSMAESTLTGNVSSITQQSNSEWHDAMRQFCSSLWGTTAWGGSREGYEWKHDSASSRTATHPVMTVLFDTAQKVGDLLYDFAEAAVYINREVWDVYTDAIREAIPKVEVNLKDGVGMDDVTGLIKGVVKTVAKGASQLGVGIVLNIDTPRLNAIVNEYNRRVNALVPQLNALMGPLDEAHRSAPKFEAQEARAEAFGKRALNEFKKEHRWTDPDDTKNGVYKIDLAGSEWMNNGHTLDKHVGKSDEQLAQRLRDQSQPPTPSWPHNKPTIAAASTFENGEKAQELTQHNIAQNSQAIKAWLEGPPPPTNGSRPESFDGSAPSGEYSGRSVSKQPVDPNDPMSGFKQGGLNAKAVPVTGIRTVLKYDDSLDPPFVVLTSMPVP
ncbi:RNase A-like domain-containing protein [Streptomyces apocyni]|uniref:RNase A-like domain-containing protein n=1 Tax=Streptomyces apocyni TaxID=2654677 RepID=UPI0018D06D24|nr:RNase A-like domain-containing protein [Streptomyces apocyni]